MEIQTILDERPPVSHPKGLCCSRCFQADTDKKRCKCRCGGTFHGQAHQHKTEENQ